MNICMAVGEAAGIAAALSAASRISPRKLPAAAVQEKLLKNGVSLFG